MGRAFATPGIGDGLDPRPLDGVRVHVVKSLHHQAGRGVDVREVMNGVLYFLETGCQWRALPQDLPPKSTVYDYLMLWDWDGTWGPVRSKA